MSFFGGHESARAADVQDVAMGITNTSTQGAGPEGCGDAGLLRSRWMVFTQRPCDLFTQATHENAV